ncbi:MAG: DUF2809 domain-containing protein [Bacteroidota bacterium]
MKKSRFVYGFLIVAVIAAGILSRQVPVVPSVTGDVLWAVMVFLIIRFLFIRKSLSFTVLTSLSFCFLIEASQLYHKPWIDNIRHTTLGGLVFGHGFLWIDILAYTLGIGLSFFAERIYNRKVKDVS